MASAKRCMLSEAIPTPRGSVECRNNAQRDRQQGNWFCHDLPGAASSAPAQIPVPVLPARAAGLASTDMRGSDLFLRSTQRHSEEETHDWYKYGSDYKDEIIGHPSASRNTRGTMANGYEIKKKMTDCNSNNWFRHEHTPGEEIPVESEIEIRGKRHPKSALSSESPNSPLWAIPADNDDATRKPAQRPETAEYMSRYKSDMSSGWFAHGGDDGTGSPPSSSSRYKGSKESEENAAKIKGGSKQNWFYHDENEKYVDPKPAVKLTSPEAKLLMERARGDGMKLLFRMDQNTNST